MVMKANQKAHGELLIRLPILKGNINFHLFFYLHLFHKLKQYHDSLRKKINFYKNIARQKRFKTKSTLF